MSLPTPSRETGDILLTILSDALSEAQLHTWRDDLHGYGMVLSELITLRRWVREIRDETSRDTDPKE